MATIKEHLQIALKEIGSIKPWFDSDVEEWIFSHPSYPVEYGGKSSEEVKKNYPKYLREFIKHRLDNRLNPLTEKKTKGLEGKPVAKSKHISEKPKRKLGVLKGKIKIPKGFNAPLPEDFLDEFEKALY